MTPPRYRPMRQPVRRTSPPKKRAAVSAVAAALAQAPMGVAPATLAQHFGNFATKSGFPVRDFTFGFSDVPGDVRDGWVLPGQVNMTTKSRPAVESLAARYGRRGPLNRQQVTGASSLLHDVLHQMRYGRTPPVDGQPVNRYEEGATESVTRDLLPLLTRALFGANIGPVWRDAASSAYQEAVTQTRQLSTFGSGARKWNDYGARVWRRKFLHADDATRQQMVDAAMAARTAWGARTGRP